MIDITLLTPQELDRFLHLQSIVDRQAKASARVRALRAYYDGDHPIMLTQRQQEFLGDLVSEGEFVFAHNLVRTVIDTLRERIDVVGFAVNGEGADDADDDGNLGAAGALAAQLWAWWNVSRLDSQQVRMYRRALRDGRAYAIVDFDNETGAPRVNLHKVDDGKTGVTMHRDPTDTNRVMFANRYFYTFNPLEPGVTGLERKTTYLPGEIRKYIRRRGGDWSPYPDEDAGVWPLPWVGDDGQPLGIPVFEFENPGGSEVAQIIGLQNALNKSWLDLIAAADTAGFPLIAVEYDSDGSPMADISDDDDLRGADEFRIAPGRAIEVDNARVHRLEAANLQPMIETTWALVTAIAGVSRTPQYYLRPVGGGDVPSGEALKQLESGLVRRAEDRHRMFGQAWADAMSMCYRVAQTFGTRPVPLLPQGEPVNIATQWADPNVRNELVQAQTAQLHAGMNVPEDKVWQLLGYEPEEIARFGQQRRADQAAQVANIAAALRVDQQRQAPQTNPAPQSGGA
jgi:hypothetical protein